MSRSSREITFPCAPDCKAFHARPYSRHVLQITRQRLHQLVVSGELQENGMRQISCESMRKYVATQPHLTQIASKSAPIHS